MPKDQENDSSSQLLLRKAHKPINNNTFEIHTCAPARHQQNNSAQGGALRALRPPSRRRLLDLALGQTRPALT